MNNYIDVDKLITEIENMSSTDYGSYMDYDVHRGANYMKHDVLTVIDEQPTADVVEVTRCEDCRFSQYDLEEQGYMEPPACDGMWCERDTKKPVKMNFTDYCSYGKRREK